jgi:hypothetical protein
MLLQSANLHKTAGTQVAAVPVAFLLLKTRFYAILSSAAGNGKNADAKEKRAWQDRSCRALLSTE